MDEQPVRTVKLSLKVKFTLMIALLTLIIITGNWISFQQSKNVVLQELETRGIWIARNLAYDAWYGVLTQNKGWLSELTEGVIHEEDIMYVALIKKNGDVLIATSQKTGENTTFLPEKPQHACETPAPYISSRILFGEQVSVIESPIIKQEMAWQMTRNGTFFLERGETSGSAVPQASFVSSCLGTVQLGISLKNVDYKLTRILLTFVLLSVLVIGIGILGYVVASRILVSPILHMADVAIRISEGDLRHTMSIVHSQDEVEILETALLRILNASRQIAEQLKNACARITVASDDMLSMAEELSSVSQRQSASIYHLSENLETNAEASRTIAENSNSVARIAESTFLATHEVKDAVQNTITSMHEIREQTGKDSDRIVYLGEKVSQIGNVVTMINTIADQTRLIAFNASIEAAGAGETGGRFSIVATEVRRLANTVVEALEEIRELVSSIQSATRELILASETGIRKVNQGVTSITETGQTLQQIIDMIDSTTRSAKEISVLTQQQQTEYGKSVQEIKEIADTSEQSVDMSKRSTHIARELRTLANELDAIIQNFLT